MASIKYKDGDSWIDIRNTLYPVGSIYMSTSNTSPATLFGGTWNPISGALLGATGTGITNGTYSGSRTIKANQLPNHFHDTGWPNDTSVHYCLIRTISGKSGKFTGSSGGAAGTNSQLVYATRTGDYDDLQDKAQTGNVAVPGGGSSGHDYQPYTFGCYMWQRTA